MVITAEIIRPRLRSDIVIEQQRDGSTIQYLIVDPVRNRYWQCGSLQFRLLALFNGELAQNEIVARYIEQTHIRIRSEQVDEVLRRLDSLGLLVQSPLEQDHVQTTEVGTVSRTFHWQDAVSRRWRVYPADRLLHPLEAIIRWLFTSGFIAVYALLAASEIWILVNGGWVRGILPFWSRLYLSPSLASRGPDRGTDYNRGGA